MREALEKLIRDEINPILALHSGECSMLSFIDNVLSIRLVGGCIGCPSSRITLYNGIIPLIQEKFPDITVVVED